VRRYAKPKLKHLRRIAIDEIAVAKGHRYLTVVLDLDSGRRWSSSATARGPTR
jgi:transposase